MRRTPEADLARFSDMFAAMGTESRLRIVRELLKAHPDGLTAGAISDALDISPSTLSHHLDRLKREDVIAVRRAGTFLHYTANTESLEQLLQFLYAECCTGGCAVALEPALRRSPHTSEPVDDEK